jgi:hypothetical protein
MAGNEDDVEVEVDGGCIQQTDRPSYSIWQYFTVSNASEAKNGGAKIAVCRFCDKTFSGCCTTRAGHQAFAAKFVNLTRKSLLLPGTGTLFPSMCIGAAVNVSTSQLSVMPTSSRCLLGMMKMCSSITPALCAAWPGQVRSNPSDP